MKIAISATKPDLEAEVDARFGRCQHFIIVDSETKEFEALDNTNTMAAGGAGVSTAQMIAAKGVEAVLTGNCGPNAYQVLSSSGIRIVTGVSGTIRGAIEGYRSGRFQAGDSANVLDHFGAGANPGMGGGFDTGRGIGHRMSKGKGMKRGMGGEFIPPTTPNPQPSNSEEEIEILKAQSQELAQKLAEVQHRIEELGKEK